MTNTSGVRPGPWTIVDRAYSEIVAIAPAASSGRWNAARRISRMSGSKNSGLSSWSRSGISTTWRSIGKLIGSTVG